MRIESETYQTKLTKPASWEECAFLYCTFSHIKSEGAHVTSVFVDCTIDNCDFYWGLFNVATFVGVKFQNCTFRGTGIAGCRFVECRFDGCSFIQDNLGGSCSFDGTRWHGCEQSSTQGLDAGLVPRRRAPHHA